MHILFDILNIYEPVNPFCLYVFVFCLMWHGKDETATKTGPSGWISGALSNYRPKA